MKKNKEAGFTLTETLIVLLIVLTITSITMLQYKPFRTIVHNQFFVNQLANDIYYAQMYAIANQTSVTVNFIPMEHFYYMRVAPAKQLMRRYYDSEITVGSPNTNLHFLPNGNISKFGSFNVSTKNTNYRIVFQIGRGRFYIVNEI